MTIEKAIYGTYLPEHGFSLHPNPPRAFVEACGKNSCLPVTVIFPDNTRQEATLWLGRTHIIRLDGWRGWIDTGYLVGIPQEMERSLEGAEIWWDEPG
jgi:hypothetical protein